MRKKGPQGLAVILIALGVLILLGKLTPILGSLIGGLFALFIPILMIGLGYYGIRRGNAFFGWIILAIGLFSLIAKLSVLLIPLLGIGLVLYGISSLRGKRSY